VTAADVDVLQQSLSGPEGWMPAALRRLEQDPVAGRLREETRPALARAARAAGAAMARAARRGSPASAVETLRRLGVEIVEDGGEACSGPLIYHARYTTPPPRVTLYRRPIAVLEHVLGHVDVREIVLAHELFHHLVQRDGAPDAVRPRVTILRIRRWRREAVVRAAEEIAAAAFAGVWCGLEWGPDLLDAVTERTANGS
jgi:hypothetical protein